MTPTMTPVAPPDFIKPEQMDAYQAEVAHRTGKNLPVIIDGPGRYRTRNGRLVVIQELNDPARASANCRGTWYKPNKRGKLVGNYSIWQPNGRFRFLDEHPLDVVAKETGNDAS